MKRLAVFPVGKPRSYSRRDFVNLATIASAAFALAACGQPSSLLDPPASTDEPLPVGLDSLGGAPNTAHGRAIAAFCDTVVPSKRRDLTGAIGAIDVNAPALFFDPALPVSEYLGLIVLILDGLGKKLYDGHLFTEVSPEQRELILDAALKDDSPLDLAVQLAKVAFFSNERAFAYLRFPGPNAGYRDHADFSFATKMSQEITTDGNLP